MSEHRKTLAEGIKRGQEILSTRPHIKRIFFRSAGRTFPILEGGTVVINIDDVGPDHWFVLTRDDALVTPGPLL